MLISQYEQATAGPHNQHEEYTMSAKQNARNATRKSKAAKTEPAEGQAIPFDSSDNHAADREALESEEYQRGMDTEHAEQQGETLPEQTPENAQAETMAKELETKPEAVKPVKVAKPLPTFEEALATMRASSEAMRIRYAHVLAVTELTKDGDPKRVIIECSDPQTKQAADGTQVSVCAKTRETAVQDLFQVYRCSPCADRAVRKARRNRSKRKDKALRQQVRAAREA